MISLYRSNDASVTFAFIRLVTMRATELDSANESRLKSG
jgi:hypothetical protein